MPRRCTIEGCFSKSGQPEHRGVTFHSFPFESKTREIWLSNCRIPNVKNITKSVLVCSRHFKRADFQPVKGNKYMVKQGTYPTIFPWGKVDTITIPVTPTTETKSIIKANTKTNTKQKIIPMELTDPKTTDIIGGELIDTKIQVETNIKSSSVTLPSKRSSTDSFAQLQLDKPAKIPKINDDSSIAAVVGGGILATVSESSTSSTPLKSVISSSPRSKSDSLSFVPGVRLEAQDFDGAWHAAKIIEVDNDDCEVLIKFEKSFKSTNSKVNSGTEEWIPMNSSRLRQIIEKITNTKIIQSFIIGEKCMARWSGARKFPATIIEIMENDMYEVLFEDGFQKIVKANYISKIKQKTSTTTSAAATTTSVSTPNKNISITPTTSAIPVTPTTPVTSSTTSKSNKSTPTKKLWPLISRESLNFDELNLATIPEDGEWCCHWVNDQPIGKEGFLMVGDHKKPTVIVEDWRLPTGWIKHMYQRSNVLGKWDVILVSPSGKRFRSKADLKQFIEEQGQVYNPDIYDFSIHRRRAKDINAYAYTKDYKPPQPQPKESAFAGITPAAISETSTLSKSLNSTALVNSSVASETDLMTPPPKIIKEDIKTPTLPLEDGFVYVGALKVQLIENLFRCPEDGCNKNFRKENHLQIHVKHYHHELAKLLGVCPNMQELAWKRTVGATTHEEPLPKNLISNSQFFAKVHQQDMQSRTHRKSSSTPHTPNSSAQTSPSLNTIVQTQSTTTTTEEQLTAAALDKIIATIAEQPPPTILPTESIPATTTVIKEELNIPHPTGDDLPIFEENIIISTTNISSPVTVPSATLSPIPVSTTTTPKPKTHSMKTTQSTKKSSSSNSARKSNRQRTTKKYLTANLKNPSQVFDASFPVAATTAATINDFEETRHSFNATPDKLPTLINTSGKKSKIIQNLLISESNDGNNTTSSLPEQQIHTHSQSPKYINENGELIKIVRMRQEEIINCLCSYGEEDGLMIQCELCLCWQHGICNGFEKQSQVPDKYVCYICRNPQRGRSSLKYIHDQDWLYDGKLPIANYHAINPNFEERFDMLKKSHTLTGNLLEIRKFLHSLRVKINIAQNKDHPKMYLWAKKWEKSPTKEIDNENYDDNEHEKDNKNNVKDKNDEDIDMKDINNKNDDKNMNNDDKIETKIQPTIPQPEAAIDSVECQRRLLEHIKNQQSCVMDRLQNIEDQIMEMESVDSNTEELDGAKTREILSLMIRDLEVMKNISKINTVPKSYKIY